MKRGPKPIGGQTMTPAEPQARYRAAHANDAPKVRYRKSEALDLPVTNSHGT